MSVEHSFPLMPSGLALPAVLPACKRPAHPHLLPLQEVAIMRKVRHRNVVQFIGACTQKPNLCIVFEFMAGGSIFDHMRKVGSLCNAVLCGAQRVATALAAALPVMAAEEHVVGKGALRQLFHPNSSFLPRGLQHRVLL